MELRNAANQAVAVADPLAAIEARLERIERMLSPLSQALSAAPGGTAVAADMLDEWARRDGQMDARVRGLGELLTRLTEPATLRTLSETVQQVQGLQGLLATAADAVDELAAQDGRLDQRVRGVAGLIKQFTEPTTLQMLSTLTAQAQTLPALLATVVDAADDLVAQAARRGLQLEDLLAAARRGLGAMSRLAASPEMQALLDSRLLSPETLRALDHLSIAIDRAGHSSRPTGLWGALRASRDAAFQRTVGFAVSVATELGRVLQQEEQPKRLEEGHA